MKKSKRQRSAFNHVTQDQTGSSTILEVLMASKSKAEVYIKLLDDGVIDYADINAIKKVPHPLFQSLSDSSYARSIQLSSFFEHRSSSKVKSFSGKDFYDLSDGIGGVSLNFDVVQRNEEQMQNDIQSIKQYFYHALSNEWLLIKLLNHGFDPLQILHVEKEEGKVNLISVAAANVMPSLLDAILHKSASSELDDFLLSAEAFKLVENACINNDLPVLEVLNKHNYDFFQLNPSGNQESFLFYCQSAPVLDFLLKQGLDINQTNVKGLNPVEYWSKAFNGDELIKMQKMCEELIDSGDKEEALNRMIKEGNQNGLENFTFIPDWYNRKDKNGVLFAEKLIDAALNYRIENFKKKKGDYSGPSFRNFRDVIFKIAKNIDPELLISERGPMDFANKFKLFAHLIGSSEEGQKLTRTVKILKRRKIDDTPQIFTEVMFDWILQKTLISTKKEQEDYQSLDSLKFKIGREYTASRRSGLPQLSDYINFIMGDVKNGSFVSDLTDEKVRKYSNFCIAATSDEDNMYECEDLSHGFHSNVLLNIASASPLSEKSRVHWDILKVFLTKCVSRESWVGESYAKRNSTDIKNENLDLWWSGFPNADKSFDSNLVNLAFAFKYLEIKIAKGMYIDEEEIKAIQNIINYFEHPQLLDLIDRQELSEQLKKQIKPVLKSSKPNTPLVSRF